MKIRDTQCRALVLSLMFAAPAACGDDVALTRGTLSDSDSSDSFTSTTSTNIPTTSTGSTEIATTSTDSTDTSPGSSTGGSSTGEPGPCGRVHEGDLYVSDESDLTTLGDIGRVTGNLYISFSQRDQRDLAFMDCLHTIDLGLSISTNKLLESTEGFPNLINVGVIAIFNNPNLRLVSGFDNVIEIASFQFSMNPAVEEIEFDSLRHVKSLQIGHCSGDKPQAGNFALMNLSGFSGLMTLGLLTIDGNEALVSADLLDALLANGAPQPPLNATIRYNLLLTEAAIHERLDALNVPLKNRNVCGNMNGDPDCLCALG